MTQDALTRRLRITGIAAVLIIVFLALLQMVFVEWWLATTPVQTDAVNQSGLRRARTYVVLYQAARFASGRSTSSELRAAMEKLVVLQGATNDLTPAERATYDQFVQAEGRLEAQPHDRAALEVLDTLGGQLYVAFDRATVQAAARALTNRRRLATVVFAGGIATVLILTALYFFVMRRRESEMIAAIDVMEERRERFAALFEQSSEMMTLYRTDGSIVRANRAAIDALGFGAAAVGKPFTIHVAPHEHEKVARYFARAVAGEASKFPTTFIDRSGRDMAVLASISPVKVRGSVTGVIGMARDVSGEQEFQGTLLRANERFRSLFRRSNRAMLALDAEGMISEANPALCELTGYDELELVGKSALILSPPGDRAGARDRMIELLRGGAMSYETLLHPRAGDDIVVQADITPIQVGGRVEGVFIGFNDLTKERALARKLDTNDELVKALLQIATAAFDSGAQIDFALMVGARALKMEYGYIVSIRNEMLTVRHRYGPDDYLPLDHVMPITRTVGARLAASPHAVGIDDLTVEPFASELAERGLPWGSYLGTRISIDRKPYGVLVFISKEKQSRPFEQTHIDFIDVMSAMVTNAIAREQQDTTLRNRAIHDPLTGLANRSMLDEHFARMVARAERTRTTVAVYYIDLDGFKPVNDLYGHAAGDEVLRAVAKRFLRAARGEDVVARVGGDEFVVLQTEVESASVALSDRLSECLAEEVELPNGTSVRVGASIGVSYYPQDARDLETLIEKADAKMFDEKKDRKNNR